MNVIVCKLGIMALRSVTVNLTCRLYTDEVATLQEYIGALVPLIDDAKNQHLSGVGLSMVCSTATSPDYVTISNYLSKCEYGLLEEVRPDSLHFTILGRGNAVALRNVTKPAFQWTAHDELCVIPPVFGLNTATVKISSNDFELVLPPVVPIDIAFTALRNLVTYTLFTRAYVRIPGVINLADLEMRTSQISHLGKTYTLPLQEMHADGTLGLLDNIAVYTSILAAVIPSVSFIFNQTLTRHGSHELLPLYRGLVPDFLARAQIDQNEIADDLTRVEAFMTYVQTLASVFNLKPRLRLAAYTDENRTATAWLR